jgi:hypothetical protein
VAVQVGTRGYMDPECVSNRVPADASSDLYALGVTLYECLTGRVPAFAAGELRAEVLDGRERAPALRSTVPAPLAELIGALLSPSARPPVVRRMGGYPFRADPDAIFREGPRTLPGRSDRSFRGLGRFEQATGRLLRALERGGGGARDGARPGLVALLGPSGSGKKQPRASRTLAGDRGRSARRLAEGLGHRRDTPGHDAKGSILTALSRLVPDSAGLDPQALVARLAERVHALQRGTLLLVDQLEELTTLSERDSALFAAEVLGEIGLRPLVGVRAVVAARRDLLDPLLALGDLGKVLLRGSVLVEPLTDSVWADVIDRALGAYGYSFEDSALRDGVLASSARRRKRCRSSSSRSPSSGRAATRRRND